MEEKTTVRNRLFKNRSKLKKWLARENIEAYRLYDRDIPQYPFIVDIYKDSAIIWEKGKRLSESEEPKARRHRSDIVDILVEDFFIPAANIHLKVRERKKGLKQYETLEQERETQTIRENGLLYKINLSDYLDSGLFLDHRPLRRELKAKAKNKSFLNLFCYTGSFSAAAAAGGASKVVSVDMSKTYLKWARDNFKLNRLPEGPNSFIHSDVFEYLKSARRNEKFDIIFCDPPSFSNSKRMRGSFDVQRDHEVLIDLCMERLNPNGELYFSNNLRKFKLNERIKERYAVKDIALKTIPEDFSDLKIHNCFWLKQKRRL